MDTVALRERLHEYIDTADEQHLTAIYELVESGQNTYDEATIKMFHERRDRHLQGLGKSYTAEESLRLIREHKK